MKYGVRLRAPKYMTGSHFRAFLKNKNQLGALLGIIGKKAVSLHPVLRGTIGFLAERLGTALQKLLQRFESAGNLR
jgi:hypothetical protein